MSKVFRLLGADVYRVCRVAAVVAVTVRHYAVDHSVFVDGDYLIKGVAGAIVWKLLREHIESGRDEFSNRELRLDARLILLQRRLAERCPFLAIKKIGRGRSACWRRPEWPFGHTRLECSGKRIRLGVSRRLPAGGTTDAKEEDHDPHRRKLRPSRLRAPP